MNVYYVELLFTDNENGKPSRIVSPYIAFSREFALQQSYLQAQKIEREFNMTFRKAEIKWVFTE